MLPFLLYFILLPIHYLGYQQFIIFLHLFLIYPNYKYIIITFNYISLPFLALNLTCNFFSLSLLFSAKSMMELEKTNLASNKYSKYLSNNSFRI